MDWALLVLDGAALTREGNRQLDALRAEIRRLEEQVSDHDRFDVPAFQQWKSLVCAGLLSCKRELEEVLRLLRTRLSFIYALQERGGFDDGEAFFWFSTLERGSGAVPPEIERIFLDIDQPHGQAAAAKRWTVAGDGADEGDDENPGGIGSGFEEHANPYGETVSGSAAERVKALYRKIVKLLHPDAAGALSGTKLELWHEAQAAYQEQDIFALELILARCAQVDTQQLRYSELLALIEEARERLAILSRALVVLAERPSWRFRRTTAAQRGALERDLRASLESEILQLQHEQRTLENRLHRMQRAAGLQEAAV